LSLLQPGIDLGVSVAGVSGHGLDGRARCLGGRVDAREHDLPLVDLARRHLDIEDHAKGIVDHRVLLVGRFKPSVPPVGCHRGIRVGDTDLLVLAALAAVPLLRPALFVGLRDSINVPDRQTLPTHIRSDERRIDVHDLALGDLCRHACPNRAFEDAPEAISPPALSDARQRRMIGQRLVQTVAYEPPDREIDLRFPHQSAIMHDPEQKAGQHQPNRDLGINPRPTVGFAVEVGDFRS
jgi:hypothetical protein